MEKYIKKIAYTISEILITIIIMGIILGITITAIKIYNLNDKNFKILSWKMAENIESATLQILLNHSSYDDFLRIKDGSGYFSIEDANITKRMSNLYANYLSDVKYGVDFANPPEHKGRYPVYDVCGSIFYDINSFKKPNKLGSDQYILPIYKRGIKYNNE